MTQDSQQIKSATTQGPVIDLLRNRWSARSFTDRAISTADIDTISTEYAHRKQELVPEGILFKLFDNKDAETIWPTSATSENGYVLHLRDPEWDRSLNQVLNDLRDIQITYMRANHLLPPEDAEANPFDFG